MGEVGAEPGVHFWPVASMHLAGGTFSTIQTPSRLRGMRAPIAEDREYPGVERVEAMPTSDDDADVA